MRATGLVFAQIGIERRRPLDRGRAVESEPVIIDSLDSVPEFAEVKRLGEKGCGTQFVSAIDLVDVVAGGEHYGAQPGERRLLLYPLQNLETIFAWHLQIEQQQVRQRMFVAIGKAAIAREVRDRLISVVHVLHWNIEAQLLEGALKHQKIIFTIFRDEDDRM